MVTVAEATEALLSLQDPPEEIAAPHGYGANTGEVLDGPRGGLTSPSIIPTSPNLSLDY